MSHEASEAVLLDSVLPDLEAEGFEVFANPSPPILPPFMRDHSPDAIALRKDKNWQSRFFAKAFPQTDDLTSFGSYLPSTRIGNCASIGSAPPAPRKEIEGASRNVIEQSIKAVEELIAGGRTRPALLMAWATFEAIGRAILPDRLQRPQTPARLIEVLAAEGHITPTEADHLRRLAESRNHLIHGGLEMSVPEADLQRFVDVLKTLRNFVL